MVTLRFGIDHSQYRHIYRSCLCHTGHVKPNGHHLQFASPSFYESASPLFTTSRDESPLYPASVRACYCLSYIRPALRNFPRSPLPMIVVQSKTGSSVPAATVSPWGRRARPMMHLSFGLRGPVPIFLVVGIEGAEMMELARISRLSSALW